ncbi:MAG: recombinase family protein, partial [Acidobacteria bacterium]|nr:recombinase family protein [Acidobacteriota bacterium]
MENEQKRRRCAIYTRYSSDLQRATSIEDQERQCREECAKHDGWTIVEEWVMRDRAVSGRSLVGRDALNALKQGAKLKPRPFDCVLIDDTSRLGRNLPDVLRLAEVFQHHGVTLQFVCPPLNSDQPHFRELLMMKGWMDEQHSIALAARVRRGQAGSVLRGYSAGSASYGYKNVNDPNPNGKSDSILGVRLEIVPEQAQVVCRIYEMYASGDFSLDRIAQTLRAEQIPPPKGPRRNSLRGWSPDGIASILRNKKYIGINEWGRSISSRNPETGQYETRDRPESEWVKNDNPQWRIVSNELWRQVQQQIERKKHFGIPKLGGLDRTKRSRTYLFSGLLRCGLCGGPINIVDGTASTTVWYGCPTRRYKGACSNSVRIRRDLLEEQCNEPLRFG